MEVHIIDETHQEFNGVFYLKNKEGYYKGKHRSLHRDVWTYHYGAIPSGFDIHHKDLNTANNQIDNLQMLTKEDHRAIHAALRATTHEITCTKCGKIFLGKMRKLCPECLAEHKRQAELKKLAKQNQPPKQPRTQTCEVCGKVFELRKRESANKGRKACSAECGKILRSKNHVHADRNRICEVCGKEIIHLPHKKPRFCSKDCVVKFLVQITREKALSKKLSR